MSDELVGQVSLVTLARRDVGDYFRMHVGKEGKLPHSPLLAFRRADGVILIEIITNPVDLLGLPDETLVLGIWPGQWRSDYFQFTVGKYREFWLSP